MAPAIGSSAASVTLPEPRRFRRRLAVAFVAFAVVTGGVLALTSYVLVRNSRLGTFEGRVHRDAQLALLVTPGRLTPANLPTLLAEYKRDGHFDSVAVVAGRTVTSTSALHLADVPASVRATSPAAGQVSDFALTSVAGVPYAVVAARSSDGHALLYLFFPRSAALGDVRDIRNILALAWLLTALCAAIVARAIARRTLRPVANVAAASAVLTEQLTGARVELSTDDEIDTLSSAFNEMAQAVTAKVEALTAMAERERRFTADVAHELRTPLTAMSSLTSVLEDTLDEYPADLRRPIELLIRNTDRLRRLVFDLLELARLDALNGAGELDAVPVVAALQRALDEAGERVVVTADDEVVARADARRLQRVARNVIENARRHAGGVTAVRVTRVGDRCTVEFVDRGPGIPDDHLESVFNRFHKADASRSSQGSGLGLAIARQHAEAQGGTLVAENVEGGLRLTLGLAAVIERDLVETEASVAAAS